MKNNIEKFTLESDNLKNNSKRREELTNPGKNFRLKILEELYKDPDFEEIHPEILKELSGKGYPNGTIETTFDSENPLRKDDNHFGTENSNINEEVKYQLPKMIEIDSYIKDEDTKEIDVISAIKSIRENLYPYNYRKYKIHRDKKPPIDPNQQKEIEKNVFSAKKKEINLFIEILEKLKRQNEIIKYVTTYIKKTSYYLEKDRKNIFDKIQKQLKESIIKKLKKLLDIYIGDYHEDVRLNLIREEVKKLKKKYK